MKALERKAIAYLDRLKKELEKSERAETSDMQFLSNAHLMVSADAFRSIGLITAEQAEVYGDFCKGTFRRRQEIKSGRKS
jgi:hypothetical protein